MLTMKIGKEEKQGKISFRFDQKANAKYGQDGEGGLYSIYQSMLRFQTSSILKFWDCAMAYDKKAPSYDVIEEAVEERLEKDGDTFPMLKEAFQALEKSGFYKAEIKAFWKDMKMSFAPKPEVAGESEKEKAKREQDNAQNEAMFQTLIENHKELNK